nr:afadin- and alpha-actinin-binding protein A isoform X1 [Hydra vulgaris]
MERLNKMNKDDIWDVSDFLSRYTTKSAVSESPVVKFNEYSNNDSLGFLNDEDTFCTSHNFDERLLYLNQELTLFGYSSIFKNNNSTNKNNIRENLDLFQLVNCTYELLKRQHQQIRAKDELEEKQIRSESDHEFLIQSQSRLKQDLENLRREAALSTIRENDQASKYRALFQEMKNEREEKRKLKSDLDHIKNQCQHELKRMENEKTKLQTKVHQLLNDRTQEKKVSMEVLNPLQRGDGRRSTWKSTTGKKNEEDMYKLIISNYEEKEKTLLLENHALREFLQDILNMLLMNTSQSSQTENIEEEKQFQMPIHLVKNDLKNKFYSAIETIRAENKTQGKEDNDLQSKLESCQSIISAQEKLIQNLKDGNSKEAFEKILLNFGNENDLAGNLAQEKQLHERNKAFIEEQKRFTEYVLKIEKEKEEFEKERVEFYMSCLSTPALNKGLHGKVSKSESLRLAQPSFSSAPRTPKVHTPSTADLYKYMSLAYDKKENINGNTNHRSITHDGSFTSYDVQESPSVKKLQQHADNVRKAVEVRHNKSTDDDKRIISYL